MPNTKKSFFFNGQNYKFLPPFTISSLLSYLNFNENIIVIDYNGKILPKEIWSQTFIKAQDKIEVLTIAGGG